MIKSRQDIWPRAPGWVVGAGDVCYFLPGSVGSRVLLQRLPRSSGDQDRGCLLERTRLTGSVIIDGRARQIR